MIVRNWRVWALSLLAALAALVAAGRCYESIAEARDAKLYPPPGKLVDVGGYRLHLLCKGASSGPAVVMVAGGGTPAVVSYVLQDRIARFARVCSYDRAGLGWSDRAPRTLTFGDQIADLENLLHNAHVPGPYIFALDSFGGLVVIGFAQKHPDQVAGIVFLDGVDPELWFKGMVEQSGASAELRGVLIQTAWRLGIIRVAFAALEPNWVAALPSPVKGQMIAGYSRPSAGYAEALEAYKISSHSDRPYLAPGALGDRPVIALRHGKISGALSDEFEAGWQASQNRLARLSKNGVVIVAKGADHEVAQENLELAARCVQKELAEVGK